MNPTEQAKNRRLRRLCIVLEVDVFSGEIIVDLLERLDEAQREVERLRAFVGTHGADKP